jgi:hypothetical protein
MLVDRIIKAITFQREVYAEVEHDTGFTSTAWLLVLGFTFLNQVGSNVSTNLLHWLGGTVIGTIFGMIGFAVAAFGISWLGKAIFNAEVTFDELVRTLSLASVWNVVGLLGALSAISATLSCVLAPAILLSGLMLVVSWMDLEWVQTIVTVILGWIIWMVVMAIAGLITGLVGLTAVGIFGALGF